MDRNKVVYDGQVLIDLTSDTVTPETLALNVKAHDKSGKQIVGSYVEPTFVTVRTGSTNPSSSLGNNGDLYLKLV